MGKPLSRPGCFQKNSCCRVKHGVGEGGGVRGGGGSIVEGGYGDGYVPQRSIYDTMCLNQQIDSQHHHHHHHMGGSMREGGAGVEGAFNYSASSSLRVSRSPGDMFDQQPRSLTPNPSFVRRLDERAIYDSLKLGVQEADGVDCHSPGCFKRSASPSVSSFSAPGISSSSKKHHQQQQQHQHHPHHHHGNSGKNRDGRHSWKVVTPPDHLDCLELSTEDMLERGGGYLNPGAYPPVGSSSLTSPLISPFSGSPHSSGYHTPHFFSPAKPRPQTQSLRCSPPHVTQPRHYSQTQSLRLSPTHELSRSPYRAPLVQLSARDLQEDMREQLLPYETADKKVDMGKIGLIAPKPDFGGQKLSVSKPNSRTRPGTATGLRPGLVSPKLGSGLGEQDPAATPDGMESTWPRRVIVRKRTVLQGGALHNLPILPPLPSVLSALEKRFPYHLPGLAHHSENPLSNLALIGAVGRCSLKEPSHLDLGLCANERTSKVVPSQEEPKPKEEEVGGKVRIDLEGEWMEGRDISEEAGEVESWDVVLEMVNTIWEDGWAGGRGAGAVEEGDTGSISGSLQRWPLLRPPAGFGGSHPPSSAASELSLTELEKRARELDSDLEHLDLSQPHREAHELILPKPQKGRTDMYQTHPGPQREKCALFTGIVGVGLSTKEDSSPDSNLTLESDSSGVFLSLSNQSQDEVGSDSDQPMSGSDLGSSSTSFDRDGEEAGVNEWGREESAELDWCYPSLLDPSSHEHIGGDGSEGEEGSENENKDRRATEKEAVSIKTSVQMFSSVSLPTSPFQQPVKQFLNPNLPMRSSGLDCGDLDPFVQSDSFVYLAVSTSPSTQADTAEAIDMSPHEAIPVISNKHFSVPQAHVDLSPAQKDVVTVTHLVPQRPEEGDFLSTDSFVYLAAPACLLLGPEGTAPYGTRDSDSDSSGSGAVDVSVLGCGSLAGDSDWDSDVSDSDPHRSSSRVPGGSGRPQSGPAHPKRPPTTEPGWDLFGDVTEPEVLSELFEEDDSSSNNLNNNVTMVTVVATSMVKTTPGVVRGVTPEPVDEMTKAVTTVEQPSTAKKVTWQFKPAQRSVCTGSRKEKESSTSLSLRYADQGAGEAHCPLPSSPSSSSSSSSSSPSSSSSG
ncbi:unnamed protein product [Merluccius merluccius]